MSNSTTLPLFVLGPDFMPMSSIELRVFEPRYKQMMDDCILGSRPFGYITYEPQTDDIEGWTQPAKYGVLAEIEDYEESGSNLIIRVNSGRRFKSLRTIQPVLGNSIVETHFPTVDELMELGGEPDGKLYIRCEAEVIDPIIHNHNQEEYESFTEYISPLSDLIVVRCMYRGQELDYEESITAIDPTDQESFLWQVCASLTSSVMVQQQMLSAVTTTELMQVCLESANDIIEMIANED